VTVTMVDAATSAGGAGGVPAGTGGSTERPRRRRRWPRIVIPLGVVAVFWMVTLAFHYYQDPNFSDPGTLSPLGTGRHGSSQLADLLRERNVTIERVTSTTEALEAARGRDATIFVPAPDLLDGRLVYELGGAEGLHQVVMVKPGLFGVVGSGLFVGLPNGRWAARTVEPDCATDYAQQAGPALVHRDRYAGSGLTMRCYGGSLVGGRMLDVDVVLVGATDPFRNDRIGEVGNAALATGLLEQHGLVIWVDVHARENRPLPRFELPEFERGEQDRTGTGNGLLDAFPVQLWTVFVLLVGAAVMLAVARARRLGPPVAEPLPVVVPASEAVTGRGRLYRRIKARGASLATLRAAALIRLARAVDPLAGTADRGLAAPGPQRDAFIRTVALRSGLPEVTVATVLFGPLPDDDAAMVAAAADLDRLVAAVLAPRPASPGPTADAPAPEPPRGPGGSP